MKKVCIIGGGIAGLSAAVFLSQKYKVTIIENTPNLGGRIKSYHDKKLNTVFDNGKHLLSGAYKYTLELIDLVNASDRFSYQTILRIPFIMPNREKVNFVLDPKNNFSKLLGIINLKTIKPSERMSVLNLMNKIRKANSSDYLNISIYSFLKENNQLPGTIENFWNIISVSTLNSSLKNTSAKIFIDVLKALFNGPSGQPLLVFPKYDLNYSLIQPVVDFLKSKNTDIRLNSAVMKFNYSGHFIDSIEINNTMESFDYYVCAVPSYNIEKLFGTNFTKIFPGYYRLTYNPIIAIHLWTDTNFMNENFVYLLKSPLQWIFKEKDHLSIVISDPDYLIDYPKEELLKLAVNELKKYFSKFNELKIEEYKIIKEKRATFQVTNLSYNIRPMPGTKISNLFLAGDYINTELPSTIESAVMSSKICFEIIDKIH